MIVCHCRAVSDRTIREALRSGAASVDEITEQTGAGSCCGGCVPSIEAVVDAELGTASAVSASLPAYRPLRVVSGPRAA